MAEINELIISAISNVIDEQPQNFYLKDKIDGALNDITIDEFVNAIVDESGIEDVVHILENIGEQQRFKIILEKA